LIGSREAGKGHVQCLYQATERRMIVDRGSLVGKTVVHCLPVGPCSPARVSLPKPLHVYWIRVGRQQLTQSDHQKYVMNSIPTIA
jgi:hypothetical protein